MVPPASPQYKQAVDQVGRSKFLGGEAAGLADACPSDPCGKEAGSVFPPMAGKDISQEKGKYRTQVFRLPSSPILLLIHPPGCEASQGLSDEKNPSANAVSMPGSEDP